MKFHLNKYIIVDKRYFESSELSQRNKCLSEEFWHQKHHIGYLRPENVLDLIRAEKI